MNYLIEIKIIVIVLVKALGRSKIRIDGCGGVGDWGVGIGDWG